MNNIRYMSYVGTRGGPALPAREETRLPRLVGLRPCGVVAAAAGAAHGMGARASRVSEQAHGGAPRAPGHRAGLALPCVWGAEPVSSLPLVLNYGPCVRQGYMTISVSSCCVMGA